MTASSPTRHLADEHFVEYLAGTATPSAALAVACHLSLCAECAGRGRALEAIGGAFLEEASPAPLAPGALEHACEHGFEHAREELMGRIDQAVVRPDPAPSVDAVAERLLLPFGVPRVVLPFLAPAAATSGWRRLVPGITHLELTIGTPTTVARPITVCLPIACLLATSPAELAARCAMAPQPTAP